MAQMSALTAFSPNTTILSADTNSNNTTIRSTYNTHDTATTSVHGITSPSVIVGTNEAQTLKNKLTNSLGDVRNLSLVLSSGVLSIKSLDGSTALSSTNKGVVPCPSTTAGKYVELSVTSNITINDLSSGSSSLTGVLLGITTAINWATDMPWFIYIVNKGNNDVDGSDGNSAFFLSRCNTYTTTPASAYIGKSGTAPSTDDQYAIILMGTGYTTSGYASLPCRCLGAVRVQYTGASTDWTFQTLSNADGFGRFHEATRFYMPVAQNGSATGAYFQANGGTAPLYGGGNSHWYYLGRDGVVRGWFNYDQSSGGTAGVGSVTLQMSTPYKTSNDSNQITQRSGSCIIVNGTAIITIGLCQIAKNTSYVVFAYQSTIVTVISTLQNVQQNNASRQLAGSYTYEAFGPAT